MERETGLEPATACLEGRNSTTELLPHGVQRDLCLLVGVRGLEPRTSWSQTRRATNCATPRGRARSRAQQHYSTLLAICQVSFTSSTTVAHLEEEQVPAGSDTVEWVAANGGDVSVASGLRGTP